MGRKPKIAEQTDTSDVLEMPYFEDSYWELYDFIVNLDDPAYLKTVIKELKLVNHTNSPEEEFLTESKHKLIILAESKIMDEHFKGVAEAPPASAKITTLNNKPKGVEILSYENIKIQIAIMIANNKKVIPTRKNQYEWLQQKLVEIIKKDYSSAIGDRPFGKFEYTTEPIDLANEVILNIVRKWKYDHTAPEGVRVEFLKKELKGYINDMRSTKNDPTSGEFSGFGRIDRSSSYPRNYFSHSYKNNAATKDLKKKRKKTA